MIVRCMAGIVFAVSSRPKNMSLDYGDTVDSLHNRREFLAEIGIDYRELVCARQVHGANAVCINEKERGRGALSSVTAISDTDALITGIKNLPLAVFTADCLPVFLYDSAARCIAVAHAGWRSSKDGIVEKVTQTMQKRFHIDIRSLCAFFGPAIRGCCYEVGEGFNRYFTSEVVDKSGRYYLDLIAVNRRQLIDSGVSEGNISDCGICTSCRNEEYFSFRREKRFCGRMMSVIMLR